MDPSVPLRAPEQASGSGAAAPAPAAPFSFGYKRTEGYTGPASSDPSIFAPRSLAQLASNQKTDTSNELDGADNLNDGYGL